MPILEMTVNLLVVAILIANFLPWLLPTKSRALWQKAVTVFYLDGSEPKHEALFEVHDEEADLAVRLSEALRR